MYLNDSILMGQYPAYIHIIEAVETGTTGKGVGRRYNLGELARTGCPFAWAPATRYALHRTKGFRCRLQTCPGMKPPTTSAHMCLQRLAVEGVP